MTVPELAAFAPVESRTVAADWWVRSPGPRPLVTGGRMVVFLRRAAADGPPRWLPAHPIYERFDVSVVWVEAGRVFGFVQQVNPGPSELIALGATEWDLKGWVQAVLAAQTVLPLSAERQPEPRLTAAVLHTLAADSEYASYRVFRDLAGLKSLGLPALHAVLADDALLRHHAFAVQALAEAGGADAGPELAALLSREVQFWRATGPGLTAGWWDGVGVSVADTRRLQGRCVRAAAVVCGLTAVGFAGGRAAAEPRTLGRSHRRLKPAGGDLLAACDGYLTESR